jgi:hypothetical protein
MAAGVDPGAKYIREVEQGGSVDDAAADEIADEAWLLAARVLLPIDPILCEPKDAVEHNTIVVVDI